MIKKAKLFRRTILFLLFLPAVIVLAENPLPTAKKTVIKNFPVTHNSQLIINNQYGDVSVRTWQKNELTIKITISGQSEKMSEATALIKLVKIESRIHSAEIKLNTIIDTASALQLSDDKQCHINYEVFAPDWLAMNIKNSFGNIQMENYKGNLTIDEKFGDFKAGNLAGLTNLSVEQGNVVVDHMHNSELTIKGFKTIHITTLSGIINTSFSYGNQVDLGLSAELQKLTIDADNVKPLIIRNLKDANADIKVHALLSKCIYNGIIQFTIGNKESITKDSNHTGGDTIKKGPDSLLRLKKFKELPFLKKVNDYEFKTGNERTDIKINVSFSVLDIRE